jgi:hypothetical protein
VFVIGFVSVIRINKYKGLVHFIDAGSATSVVQKHLAAAKLKRQRVAHTSWISIRKELGQKYSNAISLIIINASGLAAVATINSASSSLSVPLISLRGVMKARGNVRMDSYNTRIPLNWIRRFLDWFHLVVNELYGRRGVTLIFVNVLVYR